jgi:voltage-gated sodium channel
MVAGALDLRKKHRKTAVHTDVALKKFMEHYPIRGRFRWLINRPGFDMLFAFVTLVSVSLIGVEIEMRAQDTYVDPRVYLVAQSSCCVLFLVEIACRVMALGWSFFLHHDARWNWFDLAITLIMVVDIVLEATTMIISHARGYKQSGHAYAEQLQSTMSGRILRVVRLLRIVRALRIMRATRAAHELRKMALALQYSAATLIWALGLLGFVMYFFATAFTQATTEHSMAHANDTSRRQEVDELLMLFGSLPHSFYTLFLAITSGRDWWEIFDPLVKLHPSFAGLFVGYIAVTLFGVMNVVTSVFVESALKSTQHYKDLLIAENLKAKKMYVDHLKDVFRAIDVDESGEISLVEIEQFLLDPDLRTYLESMDIQPDDARTLFRLLDKDDSGSVSIDEFCQGCLRLKGEAKSFDIHCLIFENHRMTYKWKEYMTYLDNHFGPAMTSAVEKAFENRTQQIISTISDKVSRVVERSIESKLPHTGLLHPWPMASQMSHVNSSGSRSSHGSFFSMNAMNRAGQPKPPPSFAADLLSSEGMVQQG